MFNLTNMSNNLCGFISSTQLHVSDLTYAMLHLLKYNGWLKLEWFFLLLFPTVTVYVCIPLKCYYVKLETSRQCP